MEKISIKAPAKINLYLKVLGKWDDGYHEIETLMQAVDLYDYIELEKSNKIELSCNDISLPADETNLAYRAALALRNRLSFPGVKINLEKNIPMGAGLGGGSSDAAFVLRGLCQLYDLHPSYSELLDIAASLGSDIPFFLSNGQALAKGRGEIIEPVSLPLDYEIVILSPSIGISTREAYDGLKINLTTNKVKIILNSVIDISDLKRLATDFRNDLEDVALAKIPNLLELKRSLLGAGAFYSAMTGSGSSFFGLFNPRLLKGTEFDILKERGIKVFRCFPIRLPSYSP